MHSSKIQVTYDFICPWCWIGEENLERALAASVRTTNPGPWLVGEELTLADIVLGLSTQRWRSTPGNKPVLPHLAAWFERLRQQPGFAAHVDNGVA